MKKIYTLCRQSLRALWANKARSFLTMLGIIIGIGSVIALMSLGEGANRSITERINKLGTTTLTVMPGSGFGGGFNREQERNNDQQPGASTVSTLTMSDLALLENPSHETFEKIAAVISTTAVVKNGETEVRASMSGVSNQYFDIRDLKTSNGQLFTPDILAATPQSAVLGSSAATNLFSSANPIGQKILINQNEFQIIGVLAAAEEGSLSNPNDHIFIPLTAASDLFHVSNVSTLLVEVKNADLIGEAKNDIEKTLLTSHGINDPKLADFSVTSPQDLLGAVNQITGVLTALLAGIAGISLVVGGIGIMNIMLVAVTERTREIGLRKAVGAKTADIMIQFLIETLSLTIIGGLLGISVGWGIGALFSKFVDLTPVITVQAVLLAVGVSSAIGLIFGLYPAAKAAKLHPIDALRYE